MSLALNEDRAVLTGHAEITEAEELLAWLETASDPIVDVSGCTSAHHAVLQVLVATFADIEGAEGQTDWRALIAQPHRLSFEQEIFHG